jgi:hypothetical protein
MNEAVEAATPAVAINPHLRVLILDDDTESLPRTLGITEEREKELDVLTERSFKDYNTFTDTFADISKEVRHANELVYCIFHVGSMAGRAKVMSMLGESSIGKLMGLGGKSQKSEDSED